MAQRSAPEDEAMPLFELCEDEQLMDTFKCTLRQSYVCAHNSYTPPMIEHIAGRLDITNQHACFCALEQEAACSFNISHEETQKASLSAGLLTIALRGGRSIAFNRFENGHAATSALALIEHWSEL
jgi:hypothetical protein